MEDEKQMIATISPNDVQALCAVLHFYERFFLHDGMPSATRAREIVEVQFLIVKMSFFPYVNPMALTIEELGHMKAALNFFIAQIKYKIPESWNRAGTLTSCEQLRDYISEAFVSFG